MATPSQPLLTVEQHREDGGRRIVTVDRVVDGHLVRRSSGHHRVSSPVEILPLVSELLALTAGVCLHVNTRDEVLRNLVLASLHVPDPEAEPQFARWRHDTAHFAEHEEASGDDEYLDRYELTRRWLVVDGRPHAFHAEHSVFVALDGAGEPTLQDPLVEITSTSEHSMTSGTLGSSFGVAPGGSAYLGLLSGDFAELSVYRLPLPQALADFLFDICSAQAFVTAVQTAPGLTEDDVSLIRLLTSGGNDVEVVLDLSEDVILRVLEVLRSDPETAHLERLLRQPDTPSAKALRAALARVDQDPDASLKEILTLLKPPTTQ